MQFRIDHNCELPPCTQLHFYIPGSSSEFNPTGLHSRGKQARSAIAGNYKPLLQADLIIPLIASDPELSGLYDNIRALASAVKENWYGPSKQDLCHILLWQASNQQPPPAGFHQAGDHTATH